jgi:RIO kinase 1
MPDEAETCFTVLLNNVELFLANGIIHGDLSSYNVLWWNSHPFIIDFPQAVDVKITSRPDELLKRDLDNLLTYFRRFLSIEAERIYPRFPLFVPEHLPLEMSICSSGRSVTGGR